MTSSNFVLPEEEANTLRCSICDGYLSIAPIKSCINGTKYQCGRCDFTNVEINVRNFTYEKVAKFMLFPCIHENCTEKLFWGTVRYHELLCPHRKFRCPIINCESITQNTQIISHFEESHKDAKTTNLVAVVYKLTSPHSFCLGLLIHNDTPYIYQICNYENKLKTSVYSIYTSNSSNTEKYELNLSASSGKKITFCGENIVPYDDRQHCFKCYLGHCTSKLHKYSVNYGNAYKMTTELDIKAIQTVLKSDVVYCKLFIESKENKDFSDNADVIRHTIECPICKNYMLPPIYNCKTGHSICTKCKEQLSTCPTCEAEFIEARNYSVEQLAENISIPCQNDGEGCKFVGNSKTLQLHEENCSVIRKGGKCRRIVKVRRSKTADEKISLLNLDDLYIKP